ncbi:MAG: CDP-glucose 4,6-dehydratase [Desulfobacterales bacterium]|nr:CDP-glucose 4,6-dehydratase [Desulfobacterales bacterium]
MENMVAQKFWKGKSVFITGHNGFKGSWLSVWLHRMGANVTGYSIAPPTIPNLFELTSIDNDITTINNDIRDYSLVEKAIRINKPEIVFHLAAQPLVSRSYIDPIETYSTNIMGTVNILEAIRKIDCVKVVINVTSDKCYDNKEWVWGYRENDPMGGYDPYSSSKGCSELVTSAYLNSFFNPEKYETHGVAIASVRAGNVIGGGDFGEDRLVPDIVRAFSMDESVIIRQPNSIRPWQHVLEPLSGYLLLAQKLYNGGAKYSGAWNFGPSEDCVKTVSWIVETIANNWGQNAKWMIDNENHFHEAQLLKLDCSKARNLLGWKAIFNIKKTLELTVDWYRIYCSNPNLLREKTEKQIAEYENHTFTA